MHVFCYTLPLHILSRPCVLPGKSIIHLPPPQRRPIEMTFMLEMVPCCVVQIIHSPHHPILPEYLYDNLLFRSPIPAKPRYQVRHSFYGCKTHEQDALFVQMSVGSLCSQSHLLFGFLTVHNGCRRKTSKRYQRNTTLIYLQITVLCLEIQQ